MSFYTILRQAMNALGIGASDIERLAGITSANLNIWKRNPDSRPQRRVLERIEQGMGIEFEYGEGARNVIGWHRKPPSTPEERFEVVRVQEVDLSAPADPPQPGYMVRDRAPESRGDQVPRLSTLGIPASAQAMYELVWVAGGKPNWGEMEEKERMYYESVYALMLSEIQSTVSNYTQTVLKRLIGFEG